MHITTLRTIGALGVAALALASASCSSSSSSSEPATCSAVMDGQDPMTQALTAVTLDDGQVMGVQQLSSIDKPGTTEVVVRVCTNSDPVDVALPLAQAAEATGEPISVFVVTTYKSNEERTGSARTERFELMDWAATTASPATDWTIAE